MSRTRESSARLEDLPTVLDTEQICDVLRVGERTVRDLVNSGRLGRLAYSQGNILVDSRELRRFLHDETVHTAREAS